MAPRPVLSGDLVLGSTKELGSLKEGFEFRA